MNCNTLNKSTAPGGSVSTSFCETRVNGAIQHLPELNLGGSLLPRVRETVGFKD